MATAAQAAAAAFLSFLSSSPHHTAPSSSVSFLAARVLPASLRAAAAGSPTSASRSRGRGVAAVVAQLPTANPEVASGEKKIRWSSRAVRSFAMAELEARKMRYPTTGTEGLLMGILVEGTSDAAKLLRANGITLLKVREEAANVLGKSEMFYFSPMHPPLTEAAQRALDWAINEKLKSDGEVTANHLLLGIWSDKESAGHKVLASLGFDDERANSLAKTAVDFGLFNGAIVSTIHSLR
uniref:Clp R domain-containing protein n=1 Tax=Oryza glumipatula TaxID=40148 RepID=A0A0D9Z4M7_9ORYZ